MGWSIAAVLGMAVLLVLVGLTGIRVLAGLVVIGFALVAIAASIGSLVGLAMCIAAPSESGAKPFAITAVLCQVVMIIVQVLETLNPVGGNALGQIDPVGIVGFIATLVFFVSFLLFQRKIAQYKGHDNYATRATILLIGWPTLIGLLFITLVLAMAEVAAAVVIIGFIVLGVASLVLFVMYVGLLLGLGAALRNS